MSNIYWSADAHIGHQSILKFMRNRPYASEENILAHDEWIINLWQTTVGKQLLANMTKYTLLGI